MLGLVACKQFSPSDYDNAHTCPHCAYRPTPGAGETADQRLKAAEQRVGDLWTNWTETLRDSVNPPEIAGGLGVLAPEERAVVEPLLKGQLVPGEVTGQLVTVVTSLLKEFKVVHIAPTDLVEAVFPAGRATTVQDAAKAFETWLTQLTSKAGGDTAGVRLVVDQENP